MKIGTAITLDPMERKIAIIVGSARTHANRSNGVEDMKASTLDGLEIDIQGFAGEMAFGKMFNLYPDLDIQVRRGSADFVLDGRFIDVKTTARKNPDMIIAKTRAKNKCDFFALMEEKFPIFIFRGFFPNALVDQEYWNDRLPRPAWIIPAHDLRDWSEVK